MFPIYFKFRGGKGVATALGVTTALAWQTFPIVMIPFVIIVAVSKNDFSRFNYFGGNITDSDLFCILLLVSECSPLFRPLQLPL